MRLFSMPRTPWWAVIVHDAFLDALIISQLLAVCFEDLPTMLEYCCDKS
jgi:hypothetical protein